MLLPFLQTQGNTQLAPPSFNYFFVLSPDLLCILDQIGSFKAVNPMWEKALGFGNDELLDQTLFDLVHPDDRALTRQQLDALATANCSDHPNDEIASFENRCRCADGSYCWLLWSMAYSADDGRIYAVARDITDRKRSQQALLESEERFHYLIENVKDYAIYMLDPQGHIVSWNQGAERINGYREQEIIGQHVSLLYSAEDVAAGKPDRELEIAAAEGRFEDESWRVRRDGSAFWVNAVVTALRDEQGQLRGFAKVVRDVTECRLAEEALQRAYSELEQRVEERTEELWRKNDQLEQAHEHLQQLNTELVAQAHDLNQAMQNLKQTQVKLIQSEKMSSLGQLVAGVAHEINNPVNFIYGNLNYASRYIDNLLHLLQLYQKYYPQPNPEIEELAEAIDLSFMAEDLPKLLASMKIGADRIRQIVLSLRNFSRLDQSAKKPVNIHEGIDNTLLILQHRLKPKSSRPEITIIKDYSNLPLIECYAGQLNQVFMNILTNAIDALEDKFPDIPSCTNPAANPTIHIYTELLNNRVAVHIADNGDGISEQARSRLFDPFFTTKPIGKGTGLGLSISYQVVVEQHGGQLKCHSSPGQGTEFIIEIPLGQNTLSSNRSTKVLPHPSCELTPIRLSQKAVSRSKTSL